MAKWQNDRNRNNRYRGKRQEGKKKKRVNVNAKRCPHCGHEMRARGAADVSGSSSWKCKDKKCGRTVWKRKLAKPPVPIVPVSYLMKG